jgi:hypothetical protein
MATGTVTLFWYVCCGAFTTFTIAIGWGLFVYGEREKRKRQARNAQVNAGAPLDPPGPSH